MISKMIVLVWLVLLMASGYLTSAQQREDGICMTPNSKRGFCDNITQCSSLKRILTKKPMSESDKTFLQQSQCGMDNSSVLVCCPDLLPEPGLCGVSEFSLSRRIVGGNETGINDHPWMALIIYEYANKIAHNCGGTLINHRFVLTAGHCITGIPTEWNIVSVRLGDWDTSTDPDCEPDFGDCNEPYIEVDIERTIVHPKFNAMSVDQLFDIALIRLSRSVTYTNFIRPLCLPISSNLRHATFDGVKMDVVGWGKTESGAKSDIKLKAVIPVVPYEECKIIYKASNKDLQKSQICAGGQMGVDSCRGDSGGPLVGLDTSNKKLSYNFIVGVNSYGPTPCGLKGWPGVYTRVGDFIDWINENIRP